MARAALAVYNQLPMVDIPGSPPMGDVTRPWITEFVASVFGAYDEDQGRQLINEFFMLVSKKNSKSTTAAGIMLTALVRNRRHGAEYLILAPTMEIANNSFSPAERMIDQHPRLKDMFKVQTNTRTITHINTEATLKVVAASNETVSGKKATGILVDELWLFGKRAGSENMLREAQGGRASRPEGFTIFLSTMADEPPQGVFKSTLDAYRDIRDGNLIDPKRLGILYEFPEDMIDSEAFREPKNFYVTNPNLGASVDPVFVQDQYVKAVRDGPVSFAGFAAKHLNVEIGMGLRGNRWPGAEYWLRRAAPSLTLDEVIAQSEVVIVGVDGGGLDDLFGLAVLGRHAVTKNWFLWSHAWCHTSVLQRRRSIETTLRDFEKEGDLTIVTDSLEDLTSIVDIVRRIKDQGLLGAVGVDPAGIGQFADAMADIGVTVENKLLRGIGQGYQLMNAIKTTERRLANGTLIHSGSKLMNWCVRNLKIEPTATAIRATKQNAGDDKIDPAMAMFNAVDLMSLNPSVTDGSYLDTEELLVI